MEKTGEEKRVKICAEVHSIIDDLIDEEVKNQKAPSKRSRI